MLSLSEILSPDCIQLDMQASCKKEALQELVDLFVAAGKLEERGELVGELLAQEKRISTGIGDGIAIPHKLTRHAPKTMIAFGRQETGLDFDSLDRQPVYLVFLILGPPRKVTEHLQVLSKLSRLLHNKEFRQQLSDARRAEDLLAAIRQFEAA